MLACFTSGLRLFDSFANRSRLFGRRICSVLRGWRRGRGRSGCNRVRRIEFHLRLGPRFGRFYGWRRGGERWDGATAARAFCSACGCVKYGPERMNMPAITHILTTAKSATRFEENVFRLGSAFRAASRSMLRSWHSQASESTRGV